VLYWPPVKVCSQCAVQYPDALEFCPRDGERLPLPPGGTQAMYDPLIGTTIDGRYIIEALLGEGGMGQVYAARHAIIDKRVAIKVLRKEAAADESSAQRFIVEAKAASKIGHQHIVDITDFGVLPAGNAYFVMEHFAGPTLGKLIHDLRTLPPTRAIGIAIQTARGLHAAHMQSIIHRDLKPENIFVLERDGQTDFVKIVDFGIAKDVKAGKRLTAVGMVLGTPEYMSPEQATGQETDHRVDQYALGCILYEMLTGDVPFKAENAPKTLTKHVFEAVVPPSKLRPELAIPDVVEKVVMRMLEKKPEQRYADMMALIAALESVDARLRSSQPQPLRRAPTLAVTPTTNSLTAVPRTRTGLYLVTAAAGAAAVLLVAALVMHKRLPPVVSSIGAPPATPPTTIGSATAPTAATASAAATADVEIQITTDPPGAEVMLGNERLGMAPIDVKRARDPAPSSFIIRRAGYKDVTRSVTLDRDQTLAFVLQPKRERVGTRQTSTATATATPVKARSSKKEEGGTHAPAHHTSDLRNPFE
jgi:eukaryotic-like serine/threonine-protein kinase